MRRVSFRSALTATLATRMVPVLARDARRIGEAQRCRPGSPRGAPRGAARAPRRRARPRARRRRHARGPRLRRGRRGRRARAGRWSRHDLAFARRRRGPGRARRGGARSRAWRRFEAYPALARAGDGPRESRLAVALARVRAARRSPSAGGSSDERARARARHLHATRARAEPALRDVSLEIAPGEFVVLAGVSASGKSTLLRAASGLVPALPRRRASPAAATVGGMDTREHGPGDAGGGRRARCSRIPRRRS